EPAGAPLAYERNARYSVSEKPNTYDEITTYNNFYEFGTDKESPSEYARMMRTRPWSVTVAGEAEVSGRFDLEDLLKGQPLEERIYRFRCVEAWSLVVPWVGFPLGKVLARFKPTSRAKYVERAAPAAGRHRLCGRSGEPLSGQGPQALLLSGTLLNVTQRYRYVYNPLVVAASLVAFLWWTCAAFGLFGLSLGAGPVKKLGHEF